MDMKLLGQALVSRGFATPAQLEECLNVQNERGGLLGFIMIEKGYITSTQLAASLSIAASSPAP